ncbi:MAG: GWxTD domain-containing protein [Flavobacteriales bacterium]
MKRFLFSLSLFMFLHQALAFRAVFDSKIFYHPTDGPYVESIITFDGATFKQLAADSGLMQARAAVTIIISKLDKVVDFRKVEISGPLVLPGEAAEFVSIERFVLPAGSYAVEVTISDANDPEAEAETGRQIVTINQPSEGIYFSDFLMVSAYRKAERTSPITRSGMDMMPFNSVFFPSSIGSLMFYTEIYGSTAYFGEGSAFVSAICVVDAEEKIYEACRRMKRENCADVVPIFQSLDISDLPTGEYKLRLEVRNAKNVVVSKNEIRFSRSNLQILEGEQLEVSEEILQQSFAGTFESADSLYAVLQSHLPMANNIERISIDNQLTDATLMQMQSFLYTFWYNRNPTSPEAAYNEYMAKVKKVHEIFGTRTKPGWRTDRGRVYLQYGAPNTRIVRNSDSDYWPFEIWHYYETNNHLHDRRFLFYDTTLGGDMELLHSDVPAEMKNHEWKTMVRSRITAANAAGTSDNNSRQNKDPYSGDELEDLWFNPH